MAKSPKDAFPLLAYADELVEGLRKDVPRAVQKWDEEAIHDARVATRRLKAAVDLMSAVLSDDHRKPFARTIRKLRRRLGPLRDLDVMIEHLAEVGQLPAHAAAVAWVVERLRRQRQRVRERSEDEDGPAADVLARLGTWWGLREEVREAREAVDSLLAESLHQQLDAFAGQADRLARPPTGGGTPQDPHELRITGKALRYTLEMAAVEGHRLPAALFRGFKGMQEELGLWHDYVVLSERAMQVSLEELLPHHDAAMQARVLDLAKLLLRRAARHLARFSALWERRGGELSQTVRARFPLTATAPQAPRSTGVPPVSPREITDGTPVLRASPGAPFDSAQGGPFDSTQGEAGKEEVARPPALADGGEVTPPQTGPGPGGSAATPAPAAPAPGGPEGG